MFIYVRAWSLCCYHSLVSTQTFRRALTSSVDSCGEINSVASVAYVTNCGRVWRKVSESDARSALGSQNGHIIPATHTHGTQAASRLSDRRSRCWCRKSI